MTVHPGVDQQLLRSSQYADASNLDARVAIYRYAETKRDIHAECVGLIPGGVDRRRVLDAGCGPGGYFPHLKRAGARVIGVDLSAGMLADFRQRSPEMRALAQADLQHVPFADGSFDVVLSMHMLYHVPDRALGIEEMARVLVDGGAAMVVTNALDHQRQTDEVVYAAYAEITGTRFERSKTSGIFPLANAPGELASHFHVLDVRHFRGDLRVTEVRAVVAYIASIRSWIGIDDHDQWEAFLASCERRVSATIAAEAAFTVTTHAGVVVCRKR